MTLKRRILRILLIAALVLAFAGYFAFSTFLFSPTEGAYRADVATLVPRDVDFFVAKARLGDDFAAFPELEVERRLASTRAGRTFLTSPEYTALNDLLGLDQMRAEMASLAAQTRGVDPLSVFGGRDVAVAGYFRGAGLDQADWAAYGRINWIGKLGVALLSYPALLDLESQGLRASVEDEWVELTGGQLPRPIFVTRVRDVAIAGTSLELVRKARELQARGGENSFGQGATYFDLIQNAPRAGANDELELFVDWRTFGERAQVSGRWPDPDSADFLPALGGKVFQLGSLKSLAGVLDFEGGLNAHLTAELSSELMTPVQTRLYRTRGVERAELLSDAARIARADSAVFVYVQARLADLLRVVVESFEPALRSNLEDVLRSTGRFAGAEALIDQLDALFKGRIALVVRRNDYPKSENDAPNDGEPVPAWAVVLWSDGSQKTRDSILELHSLVVNNSQRFGLQGRNEGDRGVYTNTGVEGGFEVWEFWSRFVPGTGHLATVIDDRRFVVSNSYRMLGDLLKVHHEGGARHPRLSERTEFSHLVQQGLPSANLVAWVDPDQLADVLRPFAQRSAEDAVLGPVDWVTIRAQEEAKVLRERFPGQTRGRLTPDVQRQVDEAVNPRLMQIEQELRDQQVPAARATFERRLLYSQLVRGALLMVAFDPRKIELSLASIVPLEGDAEP